MANGITFDLWHTLVYLTPDDEDRYMERQIAVGRDALRASPRRAGSGDRSDDELTAAFEDALANAAAASTRGRTVTPADQIATAGDRTGRIVDVPAYLLRLGAEVDRTPLRAAPGAVDVLRELRQAEYRIAVISNTVGEPGAALRPVLRRLGFDPFVQAYLFSDEHPWTKPSPEIFHAALDRLGVAPQAAVHVGDGRVDIDGARRAGFRASILFTGLNSYGTKYRKLFVPVDPVDSGTAYHTDDLRTIAGTARSLLRS